MEEAPDDELAVGIAEDVRMANLVAVELPLAVKPTEQGIQAGLSLIRGIEELSKVTADEVRWRLVGARASGVGTRVAVVMLVTCSLFFWSTSKSAMFSAGRLIVDRGV